MGGQQCRGRRQHTKPGPHPEVWRRPEVECSNALGGVWVCAEVPPGEHELGVCVDVEPLLLDCGAEPGEVCPAPPDQEGGNRRGAHCGARDVASGEVCALKAELRCQGRPHAQANRLQRLFVEAVDCRRLALDRVADRDEPLGPARCALFADPSGLGGLPAALCGRADDWPLSCCGCRVDSLGQGQAGTGKQRQIGTYSAGPTSGKKGPGGRGGSFAAIAIHFCASGLARTLPLAFGKRACAVAKATVDARQSETLLGLPAGSNPMNVPTKRSGAAVPRNELSLLAPDASFRAGQSPMPVAWYHRLDPFASLTSKKSLGAMLWWVVPRRRNKSGANLE